MGRSTSWAIRRRRHRRHLATQRIAIATVGGLAADVLMSRLREWAGARQTSDLNEWSPEQWPAHVRGQVDALADRLRAHAVSPPVLHFVEWADLWSMGDLFGRWLTPPDGPGPLVVHADRFEVYAYGLPDGGRLGRHLANAGWQQFEEYDRFVGRLREAVGARQAMMDRAALVVLREVFGGLVTDDEFRASLSLVPDWLSGKSVSDDV